MPKEKLFLYKMTLSRFYSLNVFESLLIKSFKQFKLKINQLKMKFLIVVKFGKVEKVDESSLKEILSHCRFCRSSSLHQLPQDPKAQDSNSRISNSQHKTANSQHKNVKSKTTSTQPTSSSRSFEACLHWAVAAVVARVVLTETS